MMHWRFMCNILLLLYLFFDYIESDEDIPTCIGEYKNCCFGYFWNSAINMCDKCLPGYIGMNCSSKCPFPTYGIKCQEICNCSKEQCNVTTGCNTVTTECIPGYRGQDCSSECPYPSYGRKCDGICNCSKIRCDVSTGCNTVTTECAPGYIGMNCSSKCPFPTYGTKCQEMCNCSNETCDISTGCNTARSGTSTAQEFSSLNTSVTVFNKKTTFSSNIAPNLLKNNDRIFIFLSTFGCIGIVLLTAHLIVYIIHRRRQAVLMTINCRDRSVVYY